ncbi:hypothetical protein BIW11_04249 [Tropilaelaps mercedesae]|uniref:Uncharacterized protein n=1 Tax=Tropilaelaps mercedesae TaxID=418985 RepID=A0A1V9X8V6_9ACAR|nr:hypothetical protein BIW11_04249 [Tropilaelaps mercedesae]
MIPALTPDGKKRDSSVEDIALLQLSVTTGNPFGRTSNYTSRHYWQSLN